MMIRSTSRVAFVVLVACAAAAFAATVLAQPSPAAVSGPPAVSGLVSPTHPLASAWYADSNPSFSWRAVSATPTSAGYSYVLDQDPTTVPDTVVDLAAFGFAPKRDTAITPFPVALAAGDFNRDGRADLALVNDSPAHARSDTVTILQATSNGGFRRLHPVKVSAFSNSIAVADLNHDGKADLVVGTPASYLQATPSISVLLGRGNGTFAAPHVYRIGSLDSTGPAGPFLIADVNGDHKPDLLATQGGRLIVLLGRGNGTFGPEHTFLDRLPRIRRPQRRRQNGPGRRQWRGCSPRRRRPQCAARQGRRQLQGCRGPCHRRALPRGAGPERRQPRRQARSAGRRLGGRG
jgi:hypothetical protein